jgi:hypothetical protein
MIHYVSLAGQYGKKNSMAAYKNRDMLSKIITILNNYTNYKEKPPERQAGSVNYWMTVGIYFFNLLCHIDFTPGMSYKIFKYIDNSDASGI